MSDIIRPKVVLHGLRCCLVNQDCLSCPYNKFGGKKCRERLLKDAEITVVANSAVFIEQNGKE